MNNKIKKAKRLINAGMKKRNLKSLHLIKISKEKNDEEFSRFALWKKCAQMAFRLITSSVSFSIIIIMNNDTKYMEMGLS